MIGMAPHAYFASDSIAARFARRKDAPIQHPRAVKTLQGQI